MTRTVSKGHRAGVTRLHAIQPYDQAVFHHGSRGSLGFCEPCSRVKGDGARSTVATHMGAYTWQGRQVWMPLCADHVPQEILDDEKAH